MTSTLVFKGYSENYYAIEGRIGNRKVVFKGDLDKITAQTEFFKIYPEATITDSYFYHRDYVPEDTRECYVNRRINGE